MDELLDALDERLEKVDGVVLEGSQVRVALHGEEGESETLVNKVSETYTSRLERYLDANICAFTC